MTINLQQMKKQLQDQQAKLHASIAGLTEAHPRPVSPEEASEGPQDYEEIAVDFLEMQSEQSIEVNEQALLSEVHDALKRIDEGTYGRCIVCGQSIAEKRLEAIPWTPRCIKDEEQVEQSNLSREEFYE